jgi:hypothetical protein
VDAIASLLRQLISFDLAERPAPRVHARSVSKDKEERADAAIGLYLLARRQQVDARCACFR